jgi:MarR family transcriptional regulator, organic hydroperoxide resistance regulator
MASNITTATKQRLKRSGEAQTMLRHWREAVPNDRLAHLVRDASRAFLRALQVRLANHDVPFGHWAFLRILWVHDGLTQKQLSDEAGVMEPTTFTAVKAMEARGWIERRQMQGNRKNMHVFLTPFGRELEGKLVPLAQETNQIGIAGVSAGDLATTRKTLLAIIANLALDE